MQRLIMAGLLFFVAGCGRPVDLPRDAVARVNRYIITAADLQRELEASRAVFANYPGLPAREIKARVLDEMIVNQLLLEAAQAMNADKQEAFMREVESYWRQALLKAIIGKKNEEFLSSRNITDETLRALYARESVQLELDIVSLADEISARTLSAAGEQFEDVIKDLGARVSARPGPSWWSAGDLPGPVEEQLWALGVGQTSAALFLPDDGWVVGRVLAREGVDIKPFDEMAGALRKRVGRQATQAMMDRWIGELRARAVIRTEPARLDQVKWADALQAGGQDGK